jgi:hypothetical protein
MDRAPPALEHTYARMAHTAMPTPSSSRTGTMRAECPTMAISRSPTKWRTPWCPPPAHAPTHARTGPPPSTKVHTAVPVESVGVRVVGVGVLGAADRTHRLARRGRARKQTGAHGLRQYSRANQLRAMMRLRAHTAGTAAASRAARNRRVFGEAQGMDVGRACGCGGKG